jgi:hypothetical protein
MIFSDETEVTHSQLINRNNQREVEVHFERPTENGFDEARCVLPAYQWIHRTGYTNTEISFFMDFLKSNVHLLYKYAEGDGMKIA